MAYSTNYQVLTPICGAQPIADVSTTKQHSLGTIVQAIDKGSNDNGAGQFIYVKGVTNGAAGSWVTINSDDGSVTLLGQNAIGPVGILMAALDASTKYGWAQIAGKAVGKALALFADDANVYATVTAGSVDDAVVAGDRVKNAKGASAIDGPATGMAEFEILFPFMDDALAA
jgi:hypothetical protein